MARKLNIEIGSGQVTVPSALRIQHWDEGAQQRGWLGVNITYRQERRDHGSQAERPAARVVIDPADPRGHR